MLTFAEKRQLQSLVQAKITELAQGALGFKEKRAAQNDLAAALARLEGAAPVAPRPGKLDDLIAGKFNGEPPLRFLAILKEIVDELGGDIEPIKEPAVKYIETRAQPEGGMVLESAGAEALAAITDWLGSEDLRKLKGPGPVRVTPLDQASTGVLPRSIVIDIDQDFDGPDRFREIIQAIESARSGDLVTMKINSYGGQTSSAQAVYVALLKTPARTRAEIITAYSSGSIVAMSCDEIVTTPHCTMMIHNASAMSWGKIGDMKAQSSFLEAHFKAWFQDLYSGFLTDEEINDVFKGQDVWLREPDIAGRLPKWQPIRERNKPEPPAAA